MLSTILRRNDVTLLTNACLQFVEVKQENATALGAWIRGKRKDARMTVEDLASKAGISKQHLSVLERAMPHALTGKPVTPKVHVIDAIAKALGADPNEARSLAGYASNKQPISPPTNLKELIETLEALGLPVPQLHGGFEGQVNDEDYAEALERIRMDLELVLKRIESGRKRPTVTYLEGEIRTLDEELDQERKTGSD